MDYIKNAFDNAGSDKAASHAYHNVYNLILPCVDDLRHHGWNRPKHIMEIGYETGAGTYGFTRLMPEWNFISLDITFDKDKYPQLLPPKVEKIQCDCGNRQAIQGVAGYLGDIKFGLIVDDASHEISHQKVCLEEFWKLLAPGGIYLIEDVYNLDHAYQFKDWSGFVVMDTRPLGSSNDLCVILRKEYENN